MHKPAAGADALVADAEKAATGLGEGKKSIGEWSPLRRAFGLPRQRMTLLMALELPLPSLVEESE